MSPTGELAGGGGDQDQPLGFDGTLGAGPAQVCQRRHAAHRVPDEGKRRSYVERSEHLGEVIGELVDSVGIYRCRGGPAVATVVVADDSYRSAVSAP
jgi:hypothetical protein